MKRKEEWESVLLTLSKRKLKEGVAKLDHMLLFTTDKNGCDAELKCMAIA